MAITPNRAYNDPAIGAAFSNLASIFAPPSAQDLSGYATANAKNAEAKRMADLFAYATDPNFNQTTFDRMGVAVGNYAPTSSYYAQDQNNATTQRGQDVSAATSRANNAADNQRSFLATMYGPLNEGQSLPYVPGSVAGLYGQPDGIAPRAGTPRPLSETEQKAKERQDLIDSGVLTDQAILDTILGDKAPVEVQNADGTQRYMTPGEAARTGASPVVDPTTAIQEYEYAKTQGYTGSFNDWQLEKAKAGATKVQVGAEAKAAAAESARATNTDVITNAAKRAMDAAQSRSVGGPAGYVASFNPYSDNAEAYRQVDVLKSNASIEALTAMRAASPTGGALGSVTEKENAMLAAKLGALDPASPHFERDLQDYTLTLLRTVHGYEAGTRQYQEQFGNLPDGVAPPAPAPAAGNGAADPLAEARSAIAKGADPEKVKERLRGMGIDPGGL